MRYSDDPDFQGADLESARIHDLLGGDLSGLPVAERILARTLNRIDAGQDPAIEAPPPRRRTWGLLMVAAGLALIVTLAAVLWPREQAFASPPQLTYSLAAPAEIESAPDATAVLNELAAAADSAAAIETGAVQFIGSFGWNAIINDDTAEAVITPYVQRAWFASDGSGIIEQEYTVALNPDGTIAPLTESLEPLTTDTFPPGSWVDEPAELSLDPDTLTEQLLAPWGSWCTTSDTDAARCLLDEAQSLAVTFVLQPELMSTIWRALADTGQVRTLGTATDRIGRDVVALGVTPSSAEAESSVLVVLADPRTGAILGTETTTLATAVFDISGPAVTTFAVITVSAYVDAIGALP